ncbi:MAG: hypothetical protein WD605_02570 [Candidatus Paceibacterota bacterium]
MKTKIFLSSALVLTVLFAVTVIGVGEASAATGELKNMFPPGNNGTVRGVGMIDGHDGNKYVFQTPRDNGGQELKEGDEVFFEPGNGRTAHSVAQTADEDSAKIGPPGIPFPTPYLIKYVDIQLRTIGDIIERVQETLVGCELDVCAQVRVNADERHGLIEEASQLTQDGDLDEVERILQEVWGIVAGDIERIKRALERELSDDDRKKLHRALRLEEQLDRRIEGLLRVLKNGRNPQTGKEIKISKADAKRALEAFVNARATDPTDSDGDGYGDARIREGGHTVGAGQVAEIVKGIDGHHGENGDNMPPEERIKKQEGTITIMKRLPDHSLGVIELRMKSGTVKFFNESKSLDRKFTHVSK